MSRERREEQEKLRISLEKSESLKIKDIKKLDTLISDRSEELKELNKDKDITLKELGGLKEEKKSLFKSIEEISIEITQLSEKQKSFEKSYQEKLNLLKTKEKKVNDDQIILLKKIQEEKADHKKREDVIKAEIKKKEELLEQIEASRAKAKDDNDSLKAQKEAIDKKCVEYAENMKKLNEERKKIIRDRDENETCNTLLKTKEARNEKERIVLDNRKKDIDNLIKDHEARKVDLDLQEAEVRERERRVTSLIELNKLKDK